MSVSTQAIAGTPRRWTVYAIFLAYPVAWLFGLTWCIWQIVSLFLLPSLIRRRRIVVPRGFGLWILFLVWMLVSVTQIDEPHRYAVFVYHFSLYVAATIVFLYLLNTPRSVLPSQSIVGAMTLMWILVVVGGFAGILLPDVQIPAAGQNLLPEAWTNVGYVRKLTGLNFSEASDFLGYAVPRPATFFTEATYWAANFALLTPIALIAFQTARRRLGKQLLGILLVLSIVPFVFSLVRAAWLALSVALIYAVVTLARRGNRRLAGPLLAGMTALALLIMVSPLGKVVVDRAQTGHSNERRLFLATATLDITLSESPLFGFGSPRRISEQGPAVGTHGQIYFLLFSFGIPGLVFFMGWFAYAFWRLQRSRSLITFWASLVVLAAIVETPAHNLEPNETPVVMAAMALAWREAGSLRDRRRSPARVVRSPGPRMAPATDGNGQAAQTRRENRLQSDSKSARASEDSRSSPRTPSNPVE